MTRTEEWGRGGGVYVTVAWLRLVWCCYSSVTLHTRQVTGQGRVTTHSAGHLTSLHWLTCRQMEQPLHPLCCSFSECHLEKSKPVCLCLSMPGVHVQWLYSVQCPAPHHPLTHCHPFSYTHWHTDTPPRHTFLHSGPLQHISLYCCW